MEIFAKQQAIMASGDQTEGFEYFNDEDLSEVEDYESFDDDDYEEFDDEYDEFDDGEEDYEDFDDDDDYEYFFADAEDGEDFEDELIDEDDEFEYFEARGRKRRRRSRRRKRKTARRRKRKPTSRRRRRKPVRSRRKKSVRRRRRKPTSRRRPKRRVVRKTRRMKKIAKRRPTRRRTRKIRRIAKKVAPRKRIVKRIRKKPLRRKIGRAKRPIRARKRRRTIRKKGLWRQRRSFLKLLRKNAWGMASKLRAYEVQAAKGDGTAKKKYGAALAKWNELGGDRNKFKKAVNNGGKKGIFRIRWRKARGADGYEFDTFETYDNEHFNADGDNDAKLVSDSLNIIASIFKAIGDKPPEMDEATKETIKEEAQKMETKFQQAVQHEKENPLPESERDIDPEEEKGKIFTKRNILIGAGILVVTIGLVALIKKKK